MTIPRFKKVRVKINNLRRGLLKVRRFKVLTLRILGVGTGIMLKTKRRKPGLEDTVGTATKFGLEITKTDAIYFGLGSTVGVAIAFFVLRHLKGADTPEFNQILVGR